jgi:hypothetical protein
MTIYRLLSAAAAALFLSAAALASPSLQLEAPAGQLYGAPGQTVGWGFTLRNDSSNFLLVTGSGFNPGPLSAFGFYTDLLAASFVVIAPGDELSEHFDAHLGTGLGAFTFASNAKGRLAGSLELDYALFSVDPNGPGFDPDQHTVTFDGRLSAQAAVTAVPEPATLALVGLAGLAGVSVRRRVGGRASQNPTAC